MADSKPEGPGKTGEDTDDLLLSDVEDQGMVSECTPAQLARDHCDLLLDAIDAQLSRLQAESHAGRARGDDGNSKKTEHTNAVLSQSVSRDTGLGSTLHTQDTPAAPLDVGHSEAQDLTSEKRSVNLEEEEDDGKDRAVVGEAGEESERERCRWRLGLLLGGAEGRFGRSPPPQADSVCTEDFAARFRDEMLEPLDMVRGEVAGPGSRGSWDWCALGPGGGAERGEEGTSEIGAEMDSASPALGEVAVSVKGIDGCHFWYCRVPRRDRDSSVSLGILNSWAGHDHTSDKEGHTAVTGRRAPPGLPKQRSTRALHSLLQPPGGDIEQSGEIEPDQVELSWVQSPQGCNKPGGNQGPRLIGGRSVSMTALADSTPLCVHISPGRVPSGDGAYQTSTPCAGQLGRETMASLKLSDCTMVKDNGSGIRTMSRWLSCPGPIPEARDLKLKLRTPSPSRTPLPRAPLRDPEPPLCPTPSMDRPSAEQRFENSVAHPPHAPPCSGSTNGGSVEGLSRTGFGSAPGPPSSSGTGALTVSRSSMNTVEAEGVPVRHLAGVPVKSFDSVTIDSDLDSVRTERVRKHFRNALRCSAAVRSARGLHLEDLCTDQSDPDMGQEPRAKFKTWFTSQGLQALRRNAPRGSRHIRKPAHPRRETPSGVVRYDCSGDEETDEVEEEEEQPDLSGLHPRGPVQKNSAPWRRQPSRLKRPHLRTLTGGWMEAMNSDWLLLEKALHTLRQNCLREEERLKQKQDQLHDTELSLTSVLQQKKHAMQELECARVRAEQAEREGRGLEASLRDSRMQADSTRSQLRVLQTQRDAHMQELHDLEEELTALHRHKAVLQERTGAQLERRLHSNSLSVLERDELDRQLDSAKMELFAEQRRSRHKLDSLQERLEETQQELEQRVEEMRILRESYTGLEDQLTEAQRQREELERRWREEVQGEVQAHNAQLQELQGQLEEQGGRARALEDLLSQQEQREQGAQEQLRALAEEKKGLEEEKRGLEEEKRSLEEELLSQREEHCGKMRETQEQARRDKELELEQLRSELSLAGKQEIQQVLRQADEERQEALREQALSHTQHVDTLQTSVQLKEEELRKMNEALERQEASARKQAEDLRAETQELVRQAVERERSKWEAHKGAELRAELRAQREVLEEQGRRAGERASEEAERERRNSLALQNKIVELQTRLQEQESEARLQQREQASALAAQRRVLRQEQQTELQQLRRQLEQEAQREVSRLQQAVQEAQSEASALRRGRGQEEGGVSRTEQQHKGWAAELKAECGRFVELLERCGATGGAVHLPHNPTVAQVVQTFQWMREQLCTLVSRLQQDLDTQRRATQQLSLDKERELQALREQLTVEREQALDSLKERLIQDHIEELSTLQRAQLRDCSGEPGGLAASLRRQLQDKDSELREVQRSMGRWKEQTAARLARKFEEELTAELDRCKAQLLKERRVPRPRIDQQRKLHRLETEMRQLTMEYGDPAVLRSSSTPTLVSLDPPAGPGPPDLATFKLLRHLQSRVRQLRAENSVQSCSPLRLGTHLSSAGELAGSYLETTERCQMRGRGHIRTVPN